MALIEEFLLTKKVEGASKATLISYETALNQFFKTGGELTKTGIIKWTSEQIDKGMKPVTINHYLRHVRALVYWEQQEYNTASFKIKLVKEQEAPPKFFSDEDIKKLLVKPKNDATFIEWRTWAMVNFIVGTGCRSRTILNICFEDITSDTVTFKATKNKRTQVLPLSPSLQLVMINWKKHCKNSKFLFPNKSGYQMTYNAFKKSFSNYCKSRGVEQHNIHGLRHSFARIAVKNGMNTFNLKEWLGHSDISITQNYVHLFTDDLKTDINPLDILKR